MLTDKAAKRAKSPTKTRVDDKIYISIDPDVTE